MDGCRYNGDRPYMAINLNGARVSLDASSKVGIIDPCRRLLTQLRKSRKLAMVLFTAVVVLLFADHNSLAPNLSAVAEDFGFSDAEKDRYLGGYIAVTFFGLGAPASLLVGCMADIMDRKQLFVGMVIMGQLGALGTIFVRSFWQARKFGDDAIV